MPDNLVKDIEKYKLPIALSVLGLVLIIGGIFSSKLTTQKPKEFPKESLVEAVKFISVDISGAVNKPGVYKLKEGARIEQAVVEAGGFSESADKEFISKSLNLAQKLVDGSKVYIPITGESYVPSNSQVAGVSIQTKVNINTSSQAELEGLPGIGPVTAAKIISERPYQVVEDLSSKKVVSKAVFEKIKDLVILY